MCCSASTQGDLSVLRLESFEKRHSAAEAATQSEAAMENWSPLTDRHCAALRSPRFALRSRAG